MAYVRGSAGTRNRGRLQIVFGLTAIYMFAEFVGAWITNSLALLADATHMLTDVAGLGLALIAIWFAARPATPEKSYGHYRAEILAALINGAALFAIGGYVFYEAIQRLRNPPEVSSSSMILVAFIGLCVNVVSMLVLRGGAGESLNMEGALLEVVADLLGSLGVVIAGVIMLVTDWWYADPIISVVIGFFVIPRTYRIVRSAVDILMEGTPEGLDVDEVESAMANLPDVESVHDLHCWSITTGIVALSAHVRVTARADGDALITSMQEMLEERFDIDHTTIQIERGPIDDEIYHEPATVDMHDR